MTKAEEVAQFQERYKSLFGCCFSDPKELLGQVKEVLFWLESVPDEEPGAAVVKLKGGGFAAFWESQDYTGHGCQCSSSVDGPFSTFKKAVWLGLDEYSRRAIMRDPEFAKRAGKGWKEKGEENAQG